MLNSGFFDGGQEYGQKEFNRYFSKIYRSGVSVTDEGKIELAVKRVDSASVKVEPGFAIINGFYAYLDEAMTLKLPGTAKEGMKYRVVLKLDSTQGKSSIILYLKEGSTIEPTLIQSGNIYEISLATLTVGHLGIEEKLINDDRQNEALCGIIRPKCMQMYKRREIFIQSDEPEERVSGAIWIDLE